MEALADREHGMLDPESGDEVQLNEGQSAEETPAEPTQTAQAEAWSLPLSQGSATELPASQPQPFSSQADMEEDSWVIEDCESDGP